MEFNFIKNFFDDYTNLYIINDCLYNVLNYLELYDVYALNAEIHEYESDILCKLNPYKYDDDSYYSQDSHDSHDFVNEDEYYDDGLPLIPPDFNERLEELCNSIEDDMW